MTYFPVKSRSQNTDSRNSPPPIFLKINPRNRPDHTVITVIEVYIPPLPKPHAPTYGEALPIPLAIIVARTLLSEPLRETVAESPVLY